MKMPKMGKIIQDTFKEVMDRFHRKLLKLKEPEVEPEIESDTEDDATSNASAGESTSTSKSSKSSTTTSNKP